MEEALAIFAQPKTRRGRGQAAPPLRELGPDPDSELPIVLKEGHFGPYVTDGVTNASLRVGDSVETITIERALELLAIRREAGPAKKRTKKAAAKKKAPAKKKAATKKAPAKKASAKKAATKKAPAKKSASKATLKADSPAEDLPASEE